MFQATPPLLKRTANSLPGLTILNPQGPKQIYHSLTSNQLTGGSAALPKIDK